MAYIAVLIMTVLLLTMALALVYKVHNESVTTMERSDHQQAQYLAESAAKYARWQLQQNPGIDTGGNYLSTTNWDTAKGEAYYKIAFVEAANTTATVSVIGKSGAGVVRQSYMMAILFPQPGGHYPFDESSGLSVPDFSAQALHGSLVNMTGNEWTAASAVGTGALVLDGDNDYVQLGPGSNYLVGDISFTLSAWFQTLTLANTPSNLSIGKRLLTLFGSTKVSLGFYGDNTDTLMVVYTNQSGEQILLAPDTNYNDGLWHHLAVTYNAKANQLALFYDGQQAASNLSAGTLVPASNANALVGVLDPNASGVAAGFFEGGVDDVRVTTVSLPISEIEALVTSGGDNRIYSFYADEGTVQDAFVWADEKSTAHSYYEPGANEANAVIPISKKLGSSKAHGLLAFLNITGEGWGGVPVDSTVERSTLRLWVTNDNNDKTIDIYPMTVNWDETVTWDSLGGGVSPGTNADVGLYLTGKWGKNDRITVDTDVTVVVGKWVSGVMANYGWGMTSAKNNVVEFASRENTEGLANLGKYPHTPVLEVEIEARGNPCGLQGHYKFDENLDALTTQEIKDSSGFLRHGTLGQSDTIAGDDPLWQQSQWGGALQFDGSNDLVQLRESNSYLRGLTNFTLMARFKTDSLFTTSNRHIGARLVTLHSDSGAANKIGLGFYGNGTDTVMVAYDGASSGELLRTESGCNNNLWHHLACTYDASSGELILYYDGMAVSSENVGEIDAAGTYPAIVGAFAPGTGHFSGLIEDVLFFNHVVDASSIRIEAKNNLVAYWKFDESSGTVAKDSGVWELDGTLRDMNDLEDWVEGKSGNALSFDGVNDYVTAGDVDVENKISISAWINPIDITRSYQMILTKESGTTVNYGFSTGGQNTTYGDELRFYFYNNGWQIWRTTDANLLAGTWQHVAVTYDAVSDPVFYVDGVSKTVERVAGSDYPPLLTNDLSTRIGTDGTYYWKGEMDEIRLFNKAISRVEVEALSQDQETVFSEASIGIAVYHKVDYGGDMIDSYESSKGAYGSGTAGSKAVMATNITASSDFKMENVNFKGDVYVGVGGNPSTDIDLSKGATISGITGALENPLDDSMAPLPATAPFNGSNEGDLKLEKDDETISTNRYFDDLSLKEKSTLTIDGNVTILLDGEMLIDNQSDIVILEGSSLVIYVKQDVEVNGKANVDGAALPSNLRVLMSGGSFKTDDPQAEIHAVVECPSNKFDMKKGSSFYGRIRCKDFTGDGNVHIDLDATFYE